MKKKQFNGWALREKKGGMSRDFYYQKEVVLVFASKEEAEAERINLLFGEKFDIVEVVVKLKRE